ncbi:unnamed protein product [Pocillopora meandrina]|uniref:Uncharacterized protein n=1 Tax=Pocillopora meandrina TaxID=46732 RepID=A0AAU9WX07_9CNID|nr:unnamed protein product [Pocillopora meandrina]
MKVGLQKRCTFVQPHGICTVGETIFVKDTAAGNIFEITCSGTVSQNITPRQKVENVNKINTYLKSTVSKVKEDNNLKETATTDGP